MTGSVTTTVYQENGDNAPGPISESTPNTSSAAEQSSAKDLARAKIRLRSTLRHFTDFPIAGVDFVDVLPLFADHSIHLLLIDTLVLQIRESFGGRKPDVIIALDARGFLFGPSLALRLGAKFAPARKSGKLPGAVEEAGFQKEYGKDIFQMQKDAVKPGQTALVVDDIIATGGSAHAAGILVEKLGGQLLGYIFILEIDGLNGRKLLNAPVHILLSDADKS